MESLEADSVAAGAECRLCFRNASWFSSKRLDTIGTTVSFKSLTMTLASMLDPRLLSDRTRYRLTVVSCNAS